AKCNFCTHRLEQGLEPSCVVVCPERAIVAGDLEDPNSDIARLIDRHAVQVRKPEKGTRPKLFYIEGDEAALVPSRTAADGQYLWSGGAAADADSSATGARKLVDASAERISLFSGPAETSPRRVYDVRPRLPAWGWPVVGYVWTKSLAAGSFLALLAARMLVGAEQAASLTVPLGLVGLLFLVLTGILL